jgi:hypothetical protein
VSLVTFPGDGEHIYPHPGRLPFHIIRSGFVSCEGCQSEETKTFTGEVLIHFPGLQGLNKPIVWVFPYLTVCLSCGLTEFKVPEKELEVLRTGTPVEGAAVWLGGSHTQEPEED